VVVYRLQMLSSFFTGEVVKYLRSSFYSVDRKPTYLDCLCLDISWTIPSLYS